MSVLPLTENHFIVCGDGPLALRVAYELTASYGEGVVVILPDRLKHDGPRISELPGVTVLERADLSSQTFTDAGVTSAVAVALVGHDDMENINAGLRAQELNEDLHLVVATTDQRLDKHLRRLLRNCTALSSGQLTAPSFIAAAFGEPAPSHVRVSRRTLYVARQQDVPSGNIVCGLGGPDDLGVTARLIPPQELAGGGEDIVLAVADGSPHNPLTRVRPHRRAAVGMGFRVAWNNFGFAFAVLFAVAIWGFGLLLTRYSVTSALYLSVMDMTGSAFTRASVSGPEKWSQVILTVDGIALIPLVTAIIVGGRLTGIFRGESLGGHVIVSGLDNVGASVVGGLHDLGFNVACIEHDPDAQGIALARRLGLLVVIGDAHLEETLRAAGLETSVALVAVTSSETVNVETAMQAQAMRADLRIVIRMFEDDLARRVEKTLGNVVAQSDSYLAAPTFVAALLGHQVLRTISVGRRILLIVDIHVEPGADIAGQALAELELDRQARILALQVQSNLQFDWSPHHGYLLTPNDRLIVLVTLAGLSRFLAGNRPAMQS
jgi:Trk K+ transport system NAD-binding subunit